jgi:hypothetical protein
MAQAGASGRPRSGPTTPGRSRPIYFHDVPNDPWPMSHLAPGMGELKFLNWAYSFIAGKIRIECRDFIAILKSRPATR